MEKYGDHFNIDVLVAVTSCYSIVGVYSVVIDHFFPAQACANTIIKISTGAGFYRTQYPASYTHKSLCRTSQFTLPASAGTQTLLLCLSFKSQIPKLFRNDSVFPYLQPIYK